MHSQDRYIRKASLHSIRQRQDVRFRSYDGLHTSSDILQGLADAYLSIIIDTTLSYLSSVGEQI